MKPIILLFIFMFLNNTLTAQERLSSMPTAKRDSILVEIAQKVLKEKFPKAYRKNVHPVIKQRDFGFLKEKFGHIYVYIPDYVEPKDIFYTVKLHYDKYREEKFEFNYTADVHVIEKTQEAFSIHLGEHNVGYALLKFNGQKVAANTQDSNIVTPTVIQAGDIKSKHFLKVYMNFKKSFFLDLPIHFDRTFSDKMAERKKGTSYSSYPYQDSQSLFYVNPDERNDRETNISYLFNETSGGYVMGIITATSKSHDKTKSWLVTFNHWGQRIYCRPIDEYMGGIRMIEAQIHKDFTFDVQELRFLDNNYIEKFQKKGNQYIPVDNIKGQRIDTKFQITPEGHFNKVEEIYYQPQIYTPAMLLDENILIRQRKEKVQNRESYEKINDICTMVTQTPK